MINSISLNNYKCFSTISFTDLQSITFIGGANNTGKTVLIEAIYKVLQSQPADKDIDMRINGKPASTYKKTPVAYLGALESPDAVWLSAMVKYFRETHQLDKLVGVLHFFEPDIDSIYANEGEPAGPFVELEFGEKVPLLHMGHGSLRAVQMLALIVSNRNGVVLIDEIENGLHYRMFSELLFMFYDLALKLNVQLFITTQSWEVLSETACILEEIGQLKTLAYVRLDRGKEIQAKQYQGKELLAAAESDLELR